MGFFRKKTTERAGDRRASAENEDDGRRTFFRMNQERSKACVGWVVVMNGDLQGQDFRLVEGQNVIGNSAECDIVLSGPYISGRHAVIRCDGSAFVLQDLGSTNGTFLEGMPCVESEIKDSAKLRLGRTDLKFRSLH